MGEARRRAQAKAAPRGAAPMQMVTWTLGKATVDGLWAEMTLQLDEAERGGKVVDRRVPLAAFADWALRMFLAGQAASRQQAEREARKDALVKLPGEVGVTSAHVTGGRLKA